MKRKRAILLFGSLTLTALAYTAWCTRSMYLGLPLPELLELPEEYREDARAAIVEHGLVAPDSFTWENLTQTLPRPYQTRPNKLVIDAHPKWIQIHRASPNHRHYRFPVYFYSTGGSEWQLGPSQVNGHTHLGRPLKKSMAN